ncbi:MAG: NAD-dependent epimerase/dehydratase family protein [Acidobacteriota bacterium]|nr:NAD-dependent epimerase/dehydratase family protein [Acidobacteriota bacterium]MDH3524722.1 NAD-dependent epimerase/dehydratase family protein [Acidobacteriota bacterium]
MKVFLTGASGFVGGHLLRRLEEEGADVRCLVRATSSRRNFEGAAADVVVGDLRDPASVAAAMAGCERVFHCAGDYRLFVRRPREIYASNVDGTRNVLAAAAAAGVRKVVYTSTVGTLGPLADGAAADETTEKTLADMVGHYKRSKFLGKQEARAWAARGLPVVIVHPSAPVGDGDHKPTATGKIVLDFLNRKMPAYVDTGLNLVDVADVARGHLLAAERGRDGEEYILGGSNLTLAEILALLAGISGLPAPRLRLPHWIPLTLAALDTASSRVLPREPWLPLEALRLARHKMFFDSSKARRELGWDPGPVTAALERAVDWYRRHGYARARQG